MIACVPARRTTPGDNSNTKSTTVSTTGGGRGPVIIRDPQTVAAAAQQQSSGAFAPIVGNSTNTTSTAAAARGRSHQLRPIEGDQNNISSPSSGIFIASAAPPPPPVVSSAAAAGGLSGMMISGAKTGEEKFFNAVEIRRPSDAGAVTTASADAQTRKLNRSTSGVTTDADRIRKLEQELRKSQEQVRKKTAEIESLNAKHKERTADAARNAEQVRLDALAQLTAQHDALVRGLNSKIDDLSAANAKIADDAKKKVADENEATRRREAEQNASATMWSTERGMLQKEVDSLRKQLQLEKDRANGLVVELRESRDEKEQARQQWSALEQQLRTELAAAMKEIRELKAVIESQRENVAEWEARVNDCNEFILRICQPKFSVVKDDEAKTPMTQAEAAAAAGSATDGFVLVPLKLMLDAYELLPKNAKKTIADKYEADKKGKAAVAGIAAGMNF